MMRFTIRDLLLFTAIAALAVSWWIDRSHLARRAEASANWQYRAEALAQRVRPHGWEVAWDDSSITVIQTMSDGTRRATKGSLPGRRPGQRPALLTVPAIQAATSPQTKRPR